MTWPSLATALQSPHLRSIASPNIFSLAPVFSLPGSRHGEWKKWLAESRCGTAGGGYQWAWYLYQASWKDGCLAEVKSLQNRRLSGTLSDPCWNIVTGEFQTEGMQDLIFFLCSKWVNGLSASAPTNTKETLPPPSLFEVWSSPPFLFHIPILSTIWKPSRPFPYIHCPWIPLTQ